MPLKLYPPDKRHPTYRIRGTHLRIAVDESTGTRDKRLAEQMRKARVREIERGAIAAPAPRVAGPTFAEAALAYMQASGATRFMKPLLHHFAERPLSSITQMDVDACAQALYPGRAPATLNRQVYTPMKAVMNHVGHMQQIRRPRGAQGRVHHHWLWPEEVEAVLAAARAIDSELHAYLTTFAATGLRLSEVLAMRCADLRLEDAFVFVPDTKNGEPQPVHLPPVAVAALAGHPRGLDRPGERIFRWHKGGRLYGLVRRAFAQAGIDHRGQPHHIFRHSFATWMHRYAGTDPFETGRWKDPASARRYTHHIVSEAAARADLLPLGKAK